jgi:hypothetical protein
MENNTMTKKCEKKSNFSTWAGSITALALVGLIVFQLARVLTPHIAEPAITTIETNIVNNVTTNVVLIQTNIINNVTTNVNIVPPKPPIVPKIVKNVKQETNYTEQTRVLSVKYDTQWNRHNLLRPITIRYTIIETTKIKVATLTFVWLNQEYTATKTVVIDKKIKVLKEKVDRIPW